MSQKGQFYTFRAFCNLSTTLGTIQNIFLNIRKHFLHLFTKLQLHPEFHRNTRVVTKIYSYQQTDGRTYRHTKKPLMPIFNPKTHRRSQNRFSLHSRKHSFYIYNNRLHLLTNFQKNLIDKSSDESKGPFYPFQGILNHFLTTTEVSPKIFSKIKKCFLCVFMKSQLHPKFQRN